MNALKEWHRLSDKYHPKGVLFHMIYLSEAHASDEWPVGPSISFCKQPKTLKERMDLARQVAQQMPRSTPTRLWVDSMTNAFRDTYAAWPVRYFVIVHGILRFIAQPDSQYFTYDVSELDSVLETICASTLTSL